jgi:hypothetical protein
MTIVGYGLVCWLRERGPAAVVTMADHFATDPASAVESFRMLHAELRALEKAGAVAKVPHDPGTTTPRWQAFDPQGGRA